MQLLPVERKERISQAQRWNRLEFETVLRLAFCEQVCGEPLEGIDGPEEGWIKDQCLSAGGGGHPMVTLQFQHVG
jgi:hypothetical protein